jgi:DNA-binding response OmpR family regulator
MSSETPVEADAPLVLIADDDPDIQALVALRLQRAGYRVVRADDGEAALALALEQPPDLAVLDWSMPKLDGLEVTRRLRAHEDTAGVPVLLLTARAQESDVATGIEAGANAYMKKPFSGEELSRRVRSLLDAQ